ncbi:MAG: ribosome silencing factor [Lentisphaerae bacterium RIFOXYB12_FULL_65_16]|nr:MAG: ribosome silencing factor [Lentisphaerae bacterium RIFOXYA12_64_32]OGV90507.1 MAG: ribosome silencing factor [Lentisphaerae bacterium RIFOXYB12_FULL_65_16]
MDSEAFARRCVEVCEDRKAGDVILFDVRNISVLADFYILCTANSEPHLRAVQDHLHQELAKTGVRPRGREGVAASRWVIVDYGDVLIHVMDPERRDYYRLEELWGQDCILYRSPQDTSSAPVAFGREAARQGSGGGLPRGRKPRAVPEQD